MIEEQLHHVVFNMFHHWINIDKIFQLLNHCSSLHLTAPPVQFCVDNRRVCRQLRLWVLTFEPCMTFGPGPDFCGQRIQICHKFGSSLWLILWSQKNMTSHHIYLFAATPPILQLLYLSHSHKLQAKAFVGFLIWVPGCQVGFLR